MGSFMLFSLVASQEDSTTTTTTTTTVSTSTTTSTEPTDKPFILCSYAKNHLGTCECPGQVFIADDCRQGFYCIDFNDTSSNYPEDIINAGYDGCKNECEGQLRVAHDCHDARYCNSADLTQHEDITCPEGEIVFVNMVDHTWECKEDDGRCPGAS